jgi:flagellar biogenesis protein FliO
MRSRVLTVVAVAVVATVAAGMRAAGAADAESPAVAIVPHDGDVVIYVAGARMSATPATSQSDQVYVALDSAPAPAKLKPDDETVKRVEVQAGTPARVALQLRHGSHTTSRIAQAIFVEQTTGGVRIVVPRKQSLAALPARPPAAEAPATPVAPPAPVRPVPASATTPAPAPGPAATPRARTAAAGPTLEVEAAAGPIAAVAGVLPGAHAAAQPHTTAAETPAPFASHESAPIPAAVTTAHSSVGAVPDPVRGGSGMAAALLAAVVLAGAAGAMWMRRRKAAPAQDLLRILASRPLGGKARLVLVGAHDREILVSIGERGAKVLSDWSTRSNENLPAKAAPSGSRGGSAPASAPTGAGPFGGAEPSGMGAAAMIGASPAVAGILRLKQSEPRPELPPDDLDAEWARAVLAAAGRGEPS